MTFGRTKIIQTKMKDPLIRRVVKQHEIERLVYKSLLRELPVNQRPLVSWYLNNLPKQSSKVQVSNRCVLTNRSRGVSTKFRLSRICIRNLAANGLLPGVAKSSW